ncbi:hypothetical protein [uncultured Eubacterium sp.]|uniref:hypothetical protein n=1 Tax=uncultured Eubacterium sp. TaxID=165185 RepID=UPI002804A6B0|nr:hypothetical protein [uncultured Eubacterium sp.]
MTYVKYRRILSYFLAIIVAVSVSISLVSGIDFLTVGNKQFYVKTFATQKLADECNSQLTEKYKALSAKSNLPLDIFDSVKVKFDTKESLVQAVNYVFDENDETLKNGSRYSYFESTINEYINANDIKMSKQNIELVSLEAEQIYSDTVGIHNLRFLQKTVAEHNSNSLHWLSACLVIIAFSAFLLAYIYKKNIKSALYFASGFMAGSIGVIVSSLVMWLAKIKTQFDVSPDIWAKTFSDMAVKILVFRLVAGAVLLAFSIALFIFAQKRVDREQMRKDTRYSKIFSRL